MFSYRVKNMETFKDGNVLNGRLIKAGEVLVVTELELHRIRQSGGVVEVVETLIPNPKKNEDPKPDEGVIPAHFIGEPILREPANTSPVETPPVEDVVGKQVVELVVQKRKAGRPKKNG